MATLYIAEYADIALPEGAIVPVVQCPPLATQTVAITGSSVQSAAFNASTRLIRLNCDATCSLAIGGTSPTATAASPRLPANATEYFGVQPLDKLAAITNT